MTKRHPRTLLLTVTALGAMAFGGTAIAQAASSSPTHPAENIARHDTDSVQLGNQSAPARAAPSSAAHRAVHGQHAASRTGENPENGGETNSENGPSDGPGGHADLAGNVDHQFSGTE
jgi:hypothetical protein